MQDSERSTLAVRRYDMIGLAASAGGLAAITTVLAALPEDFPVPVVIVQHLAPGKISLMAQILQKVTSLHVQQVQGGEHAVGGAVYIAPPDWHLIVQPDGLLSLTHTETVHFSRPSADVLFQSLAESYGARAIAIVLSGSGVDGAVGARAVKRAGGVVIAQDAASSQFSGMPGAVVKSGSADYVLPLHEIATTLLALTSNGTDT
jgi:two-component system chemotaxis response regulator CheB